jgi:hypothetical protein
LVSLILFFGHVESAEADHSDGHWSLLLDMDEPTQTKESAKSDKRRLDAYNMSKSEFERLISVMMFNGFNSSTTEFSFPGNYSPQLPYYLGDGQKVREVLYFREEAPSERDGSQRARQYFAGYGFDLDKALSLLKGSIKSNSALMDSSSDEENRPERRTGPDKPRPIFRDSHSVPQRVEDDGFLWTRGMCSRTVQAYSLNYSRNDLLKRRSSQVIGCLGQLGNILGSRAEDLVRTYIWQDIIFESAWTAVAEQFDRRSDVEELSKCSWRSLLMQRQILVLSLYEVGLYAIERIAYGQIASNEMKGRLTQIINLMKTPMQAVPNFIVMEALSLKISRKMFEMWKAAKSEGFVPYRFLLDSGAQGAGIICNGTLACFPLHT